MTASVRSIHGLDGSRRAEPVEEELEPVVILEAPALPAPEPVAPAPPTAPKHRRPSRLQLWWRPVSAPRVQPQPARVTYEPQQSADVTRTLIELTDERFQALALRIESLTDELNGLTRAVGDLEQHLRTDRASEIDRSRWLLGDKLSTLLERLDWD